MKASLFGVGLLALCSTFGLAQNAPVSAPRHAVTINQRRAFQQHRIGQGVRRGQLTRPETRRLERREVSIGRQERHMRAADRGHLSRADRVVLNRRLNRTSRAIYRDKHNRARR
jgi:hypothetical protein